MLELFGVGLIALGLIALSLLISSRGEPPAAPALESEQPESEAQDEEPETQYLPALARPEQELTPAEQELHYYGEFLNQLTGSRFTFSDPHLRHLFNRVYANPEHIEHPDLPEKQKLFYSIEECLVSIEHYREELRERDYNHGE